MADVLEYEHGYLNMDEIRNRYFSIESKGELVGEYDCKQTFSLGGKSIREFYGDTAETFLKKLIDDLSKYDYKYERKCIETMLNESSYEAVNTTVPVPIPNIEFWSNAERDDLPFGFDISVNITGNPQGNVDKMCENIIKVLKSEFTELVEEDIELKLEVIDELEANTELEAEMRESLISDWGE